MIGHQAQSVTVHTEDRGIERLTQARGARGHGIEDGLHIRRRAADDAQDLARRRLLLQGLGEVAVAHLQLLEQPHILDGDDRLVGEGLGAGPTCRSVKAGPRCDAG